MKKNKLGHSELYVSELGFGCMSLGNNHQINERMIHEAIDHGINFFDTADLYDKGMNEKSLGLALREKRKDVIIATKGGNEWGEGIDGWRWNPSKEYLKGAVKQSLIRLGTDYIDLYQLHGGTIEDPVDETIEAFEDLVQEGVIRNYGISSIRPNVIKAYLEKSNITSIMMQYSLLDRRPEEWFDVIGNHHVSVIARGPVAKGILSNDYERKITSKGYLDYTEIELRETVDEILHYISENGHPLQQVALRYVMDNPIVATAIPGASRLDQLMENIDVANIPSLPEHLTAKLRKVTKQSKYSNHR
ncbi:aryl-alcohol dehydrogenase-like predicted oxidoreductase [Evansella vedderi]|uniref:Aryl-alcohol dehydrogenase-like predicted oxidoreductase n=1 Tax=Evansella vedderi TaxID=38282 RepID=A0ABT9ZZ80_9BACI|nr:aldo/keto reductase [Evansella vedderi]MDQ0256164.1 aryl-alcohol dehydrogenase-like predicted oxidoreductase [Evansella vedderi]